MQKLVIESTDSSPKVYLDPDKSIFIITGESRMEDSEKFYEPVLAWFREYHKHLMNNKISKEIIIEMHMDYYNSATARSFVGLFAMLETFIGNGIHVRVKWHYMEQDEDLKHQGVGMASVVSRIPFELICLENVNA